jgi:hypothetical protein
MRDRPTVGVSIASHSVAAYLCAISLSFSSEVLGEVFCDTGSGRICNLKQYRYKAKPSLCQKICSSWSAIIEVLLVPYGTQNKIKL